MIRKDSDTFEKFTKNFFQSNQQELEKNYPGLSLRRLKQELESYAIASRINPKDFFELPFFKSGASTPINTFFEQLLQGVPLEYITGKCFFYRSEFRLTPDVLIPRKETEQLVEMVVKESKEWFRKSDEKIKLIDVGTGSGAILLSVLRELDRPVSAIGSDISREALSVADQNSFNLRFSWPKQTDIRFVKSDRLFEFQEKFHLIFSNPPYIKEIGDRELVHDQVDKYEPHTALYLNDEIYMDWFEEFFNQVHYLLIEEGIFIMEGHEDHLDELALLASEKGFESVEVKKDLCDCKRFLILRK